MLIMLPVIVRLRGHGVRVEMDYSGGGLKKQMGLSDKLGARHTLIVGENELKSGKAVLRDMTTKAQKEILLTELPDSLVKIIRS